MDDDGAAQHLGAYADRVAARIRGTLLIITAVAAFNCSIPHDHCPLLNHDIGKAFIPYDSNPPASHHAIYERRIEQTTWLLLHIIITIDVAVQKHMTIKIAADDARGTVVLIVGEKCVLSSYKHSPPFYCYVAVSLQVRNLLLRNCTVREVANC